jgi:hypothetical protein
MMAADNLPEDIPDAFFCAWYRLPAAQRRAISRAINARVDAGEKVIEAFRAELGRMWLEGVEGEVFH